MKKIDPPNPNPLLKPYLLLIALAGFIIFYHFLTTLTKPPVHHIFPVAGGENAPFKPESSPKPFENFAENIPGASRLALSQKIDLNKATAHDLEALPGVGPKLAEKIVEDREKKGPFKKIDDLTRVPGIKGKKLAHLREFIQVDNPSRR